MSREHKPNILIVDDSHTNIEILMENLKESYSVRVAVDGEKALKTVARKVPDLILLDVMLPGISGYDICRQLKADERTAEIPIIFLSGRTRPQDKLDGLKAGADDFLTKPFDIQEVKSRIKAHLEEKHSC